MTVISHSSFANFVVDSCGAFCINYPIDLFVNNIQIINISTTSYYTGVGRNYGAPGFLFSGNNFYGKMICCSLLSTSYDLIIFTLLKTNANYYENHLNGTSVYSCNSRSWNTAIDNGKCISKGVNFSKNKVNNRIASLHFGNRPICYYNTEITCENNTGYWIFGHSCCTNSEMKSLYISIINNNVSNALFYFYTCEHKLYHSYIVGNSLCSLSIEANAKVAFESCYIGALTGAFSKINTLTMYETNIMLPSKCRTYTQRKLYTKACKRYLTNMIFFYQLLSY